MHIKAITKKTIVTIFSLALLSSFGSVATTEAGSVTVAPPAASSSKADACNGLSQLNGGTSADCSNLGDQGGGVPKVIKAVVEILSFVVGVVAIIMIVVSGLKFMTSGGDAQKAATAKTTLTYALVGLAVAALAQVLVRFVLSATSGV